LTLNPWDNIKIEGRDNKEIPPAPSDLVNGYGLLIDQDFFQPQHRGKAVLDFPDKSKFEGEWYNN
jgi:hypothetical protein